MKGKWWWQNEYSDTDTISRNNHVFSQSFLVFVFMTIIKDVLPVVQVFEIVDGKQKHAEIRGVIAGVGFSQSELMHNEHNEWLRAKPLSGVLAPGKVYGCP